YSKHKRLIDYTTRLDRDITVPVLLGGASFHHANSIKGSITLELPGFATNDDLMMSYHLQRTGVRIVCAAKPSQWIQITDAQCSSTALWRRDRSTREETFRRLVQEMHFKP